MSDALLVGRLLLAAVLGMAALAKAADLRGFRHTLLDFGVPGPLLRPGAVAVVVGELAAAALLVPTPTARAGAAVAAALLLAFSVAIARLLARGERPDCGCFGARVTPIGPGALARNAILGAVALAVAAGGAGRGLGAVDLSARTILDAGLVTAVAALAFLGWQLFRQNGRLLLRVQALEAEARETGGPRPVVHRIEAHRRAG